MKCEGRVEAHRLSENLWLVERLPTVGRNLEQTWTLEVRSCLDRLGISIPKIFNILLRLMYCGSVIVVVQDQHLNWSPEC